MSTVTPELIASLDATFRTDCCVTATLALYVYDRLTSLDQEVEAVWLRKKIGVTALYLSLHLLAFAYLLMGTLLQFYEGPCDRLITNSASAYSIYVSYVAIAAALYLTYGLIAALRVYAINGRSWWIPSFIVVLSLLGPATDITHCIFTYRIAAPPPVGCVIELNHLNVINNLQIATRTCNAVVDALVLISTWRVTYHVAKIGRINDVKLSIATLLLRDGSLYFCMILILNILNATLWVTDVYTNMTVFSNVFSIVLLSHFFLNLRRAALNPGDTETDSLSSTYVTEMRFSGIVADFGSVVSGGFTGVKDPGYDDESDTYEMSSYDDITFSHAPDGLASGSTVP